MSHRWSEPTRRTLICACWSVGITLATASYLGLIYPTLPAGLPVRYLRGEPIFFQVKTPVVVMLPALVQAALFVIFGSLSLLLLWRARSGLDPRDRADHVRMRHAVEGVALLGAVWITVQAIGAARLVALWQGGRGGFGRVYNVTVLVSLVISALVVWRTMKVVREEGSSPAETDPEHWRLTHLYFNPRDPALFVPTRRGVGWTLNFGRPLAIVLIAAILAIGVGGPFLLARSVLWDGAFVLLRVPH
jgi:uncharacterized membrane protein